MTNLTFKHKEKGTIYIVEKVFTEFGLELVIYKEETLLPSINDRRYCRDMYMFLKNMELQEDKNEKRN